MTNRQADQLQQRVRAYLKEKGVTNAAAFVSSNLGSQQYYVAVMQKTAQGGLTTVTRVAGPSDWLRRRGAILRSLRKAATV